MGTAKKGMPAGLTDRGPLDRTKLLREKVHTSDKSRLKIQELEGRLRWTNDMVAFFVLGGLGLAMWETNVIYIPSSGTTPASYQQNSLSLTLKIIISVSTFLSLLLLNRYFSVRFEFELATGAAFGTITKGKIKPEDTFSTSGLATQQFWESLIIFIHPVPAWDFPIWLGGSTGWVRYSSDVIFMCMMFLRMYMLFRLFFHHSMYMNQASRDLAAINKIEVNNFFIVKCWLKNHSVTVLATLYLTVAVTFAFAIRALERNIEPRFDDFFNAIWMMVVTMTTVGYGDIYPVTYLGRAFAIVACLCAIVMLSLMVLGVTTWLGLEPHEQRVVDLIGRNVKVHSRNNIAASLITDMFRRKLRRQRPDDGMLSALKNLREARRGVTNLDVEGSNVYLLNQKLLRETRQELDSFKTMVTAKLNGIKDKVGA